MVKSSERTDPNPRSATRALAAIGAPIVVALLITLIANYLLDTAAASSQASSAVILSTVALISLLLGMRWFGAAGMGFRGGRALTAGLGFASLVWIIFILLRFFFVDIAPTFLDGRPPNAGRTYIYLLLFEAFATQIWTYGLIFRAVSDWRGGITGAIGSGIVFAFVATLLFQESFDSGILSTFYFVAWGIVYGIIRLRTGSFVGTAIVQSAQSFTTWTVLAPYANPDVGQLNNLYVAATIAYMIIAWRLWPKKEEDYRI